MADIAREQKPLALVIAERDPTVATVIIIITIMLLSKASRDDTARASFR